jgi:hypothetical protein
VFIVASKENQKAKVKGKGQKGGTRFFLTFAF